MRPVSISGYFDMLGKCQKAYSKHLEPVCTAWGLTRSELDVILFLYNNPGYDRAVDIVERRGMAKSHVSLSVTGLEQQGLLERQFSSVDRRTAHLRLTGQGETIAKAGKAAQDAFFRKLYVDIDEEELQIWNAIAEKIRFNIENINKTET